MSVLLKKLTALLSSSTSSIQEEEILNISSAISKTYSQLSPILDKWEVYSNGIPDLQQYNRVLKNIQTDEEIVFSSIEETETEALSLFNFINSYFNKTLLSAKLASSKLYDYKLYSEDTSSSYFISDNFSDTSKVDSKSNLLTTDECTINNGFVVLPVKSVTSVTVSSLPVINSNSNGVSGNNSQVGAKLNGNIQSIFDGNADTWYEYERVISEEDNKFLILSFTITLSQPTIINLIRINPVNFGTSTPVEVESLEVSSNGQSFVSVTKNFILEPSSSKFSGWGIFRFSAVEAKYIRVTLKQSSSYFITTSTSRALRYAIGIRDLFIETEEYKSAGEIISKNISLPITIGKVALQATGSSSGIKYYISPDNGSSWYQISLQTTSGTANTSQTIPEILDFNGVATGAISVSPEVKNLRWKAVFSQDATQTTTKGATSISELVSIPTSPPFTITLKNSPMKESLKLIDPYYGSRGKKKPYYVASGTGNKLVVTLPFEIKSEIEKSDKTVVYILTGGVSGFSVIERMPQTIFVNGEEWDNSLTSSSSSTSKHYRIDRNKIEFGNGTIGMAPPSSSVISMYLSSERLLPDKNGVATLKYTPSEDLEIFSVDPLTTSVDILSPGRTRFQLKENISQHDLLFSDSVTFSSSVTKITEIASSGQYYIDRESGVLVSYSSPSSVSTVKYLYYPHKKCSYKKTTSNSIQISDSFNYDILDEQIASNTNYASLSQVAVVPGSVTFVIPSGIIASGVYRTEVSYLDGHSEFQSAIPTEEEIDTITVSSEQNITRNFDVDIVNDSSFEVDFSERYIFQTDVTPSTPSSVGDYSVDRTANTYTVRVNRSWTKPGSVKYYFSDSHISTEGYYSINYSTGEMYFNNTTGAADYIQYKYTNYIAKYSISRNIENLTVEGNKVTLPNAEVLLKRDIPQTLPPNLSLSSYYLALYDIENTITVDKKYTTPVLSDYTLRILNVAY